MAARVAVVLKLSKLTELSYGQPMSSMLWRKAQAVHSAARARAPVESGRYRDSIKIAFADTDRNVARVYSDADYALQLEFGGPSTTKHRTLGNALDAAGGG